MQQASRCPNCGSPIGYGQRFCGVCGAIQSTACTYCGSTVEPGSRFCPNCGTAVGGGQQQTGAQPQQPGWDQQAGWGQQQPGWEQQAGWGQQQQAGWGQQQQQQAWGQPQQQAWGQPQQQAWGRPARSTGSSAKYLVLILVILIVGLGGFTLWQFGPRVGIDIGKIFSGTSSKADTTKPTISGIKASTDHQGALITWTTNELSSSQVEYGTTTSYGELMPTTPATDPSYKDPATGEYTSIGVTTHQVDITGLDASTTYHFRVKSKDKAGNEAVSADGTFKTTAVPTETE